jgi:hypothetical protein
MRPVLFRFALGLAGAALTTRVLVSLLFEVQPLDPSAYVADATIVLTLAAVAIYLPAIRAAGFDPVAVLRSE